MFPSNGYFPDDYFPGYFPPYGAAGGVGADFSSVRAVGRADDPYVLFAQDTNHINEFTSWINFYKGNVVKASAGHSIPTKGYLIGAGLTLERGGLVRLNGSVAVEADAAIETVKGILAEPVTNGASLGPQTTRASVFLVEDANPDTGRTAKTRFALADIVGTAPLAIHVGNSYDLSNVGGTTGIDIVGGAGTHVTVIAIDELRQEFIIEFLAAKIQS